MNVRQQAHQDFINAEEAKAAAAAKRKQDLTDADYSAFTSIDDLWSGLSTAEIKYLYQANATFRAKTDELNGIGQTQTLASSADDAEAARLAAEQVAPSQTPEEIAAAEAEAQQKEARRLQAEADRLAAEATVAGTVPTVPKGSVEELYDGIEKLGEGSYKLTVEAGEGSNPEIFFGISQRECFKALRKSKSAAIKELRRRAKKVQITDELKNLEVETINYAPLLQPLKLTPDQIFKLTEEQKDPVTVLEATAKLRQASLTQEECDRVNESIERQRYSDAFNTAQTWMKLRPDFYAHPENISALRDLMGNLGWAVTIKNLDTAFEVLLEQPDVLIELPEPQQSVPPQTQPALVVPVVVAPAVVPPVVVPVATPAAPASALPAAAKVLRPGSSSSTGIQPTHRIEPSTGQPPRYVLTAEEYQNTPAATVKIRMSREPAYKAAVEALWATGVR